MCNNCILFFVYYVDIPLNLARLQVLKTGNKRIRIIERMASKWLMLGDLLEFDDGGTKLNNIERKYSDPSSCCREIFQCWIRGEGVQPCSWEKLTDLIEDCGEVVLAKDVRNAIV